MGADPRGVTTHMTIDLRIVGKTARPLQDTGTVGTNLMSLNRAQSNRIQTKKINSPKVIRMASKNSRAMANCLAKGDIYIGNRKRISCDFLLLPNSSYDVLLAMPFMTKANVIFRPGSSNTTLGDCNVTIKCPCLAELSAIPPINIITESPELPKADTNKLELLV